MIFCPRNRGFTITFLGPDGSGKSTVINSLIKKDLPFEKCYYFHLKPLKRANKSYEGIINKPHQFKPYSKFKSYLKLLFFIYQYNFGWIFNILPLIQKKNLVIFDRYFDDLLIDQKRYRYGGNLKFVKIAKFFIPKTDLYIILTAKPTIINKRKNEVSVKDLERLVQSYENLVDNNLYIRINVDNKPENIVSEVIKIINHKINERN